jgi:hypothetical protein
MNNRTLKLSSKLTSLTIGAAIAALLSGAALDLRADYPGTVLSLNPVAYYRLNETNQPPQADSATNYGTAGANATLYYNNGSGWNPAVSMNGYPGALPAETNTTSTAFIGASRAGMSYDAPLGPTGPFTVEGWLNPNGTGTPISFASFSGSDGGLNMGPTPNFGWYIAQSDTNWEVVMFNGTTTGTALDITGGGPPTFGTFYYVAVVYDGANTTLFINGSPVASGTPTNYVANTISQFSIGGDSADRNLWTGSAQDVAFYTNALSATTIMAHYSNGISTSPPATPYESLVLSANPLFYYRLNEPVYNTPDPSTYPPAVNLATNAAGILNGAYEPGTTPGVAGPSYPGFGANSGACLFNGIIGAVNLELLGNAGGPMADGNISLAGPLTLMAWFKVNDFDIDSTFGGMIIAQGDFYSRLGRERVTNTLDWDTSGTSPLSAVSQRRLNDGQWHHLVGTYDMATKSLYLDGVLVAAVPTTGNIDTSSSQEIDIGWNSSYNLFNGRYWNGCISEVAIWTNALTADEIQQVYNSAGASVVIDQQPQAPVGTVYESETVTFNVIASGEPTLTYQWQTNGVSISGQTTSTLVLNSVTVSDSATYTVIVSNSIGAVTSAPVVLTVVASPPIVLQEPVSLTPRMVGGANASFSIVVGGSLPYSYQWVLGTTPIPGATDATLTLNSPLEPPAAGSYTVVVTNLHGTVTSTPPAVLTFLPPPNPYAGLLMALGPYTYWPLNETGGPIAYDYSSGLNGTNVGTVNQGAAGDPAAGFGASHLAYNFNNTGAVNCGNAVVLNGTTSTVLAWFLDPNGNTNNQCAIIAKGNGSWRMALFNTDYLEDTCNGTFPSADGATYFLTGPNGGYSPPTNFVINDGNWHFMACVYDNGDKRLYMDGTLLQENSSMWGAFSQNSDPVAIGLNTGNDNGDNYWPGLISDVALFNRGLSTAEVTSLYAAATGSAPASPVIAVQPVSQTVPLGYPVTFYVGPTGPQPFTYQWTFGGAPIAGATSQSYTIPAVSDGNVGSYAVVVTDGGGSATSQTAVLSIAPLPSTPLAVGLVGHYPFDGNYNDTSGHNHNAMPNGSPSFVAGQIGQAVAVDDNNGNYDNVILGDPTDYQFTAGTQFSVAFWVNYTGEPGDNPMICDNYYSTGNPGWVLADSAWDDGGGHLEVTISGDDFVVSTNVINDGNWHHVAMTADLVNGNAVFYIDGVEVKAATVPTGSVYIGFATVVGSDGTGTYPGFRNAGQYYIDDLGIWRRLLTQSDVTAIYTAGLAAQSFAGPAPLDVPLSSKVSAGSLLLSWPQGTLESAPTVAGPWTAVSNASPPSCSIPAPLTNTFYRVHP